jgi:hypothetical protein
MQAILGIPEQSTLTASDYAEKHNISRRTVSRHIKQGKLEAIKRGGRTYVIDQGIQEAGVTLEPVKQMDSLDTEPMGRTCSIDQETPDTLIEPEQAEQIDDADTEAEQLTWQAEDYAPKLGQRFMQAMASHGWQFLSIALIVAAVIMTPVIVRTHAARQNAEDALTASQDTTAKISADLTFSQDATAKLGADLAAASTTIKQLQADLFKTMTSATELTADASAAKTLNQGLQDALADARQQLIAERQRNDDIEATLIDLSIVYTQLIAEPTVYVAQDATDTP